MSTAAVIAEFNPLHNAHADLLRHIREELHADHIIVLMSGDFVQRGEPAVMDKYRRTRAALSCGADLVLEIPTVYALAPAELYARGAIITLNTAGIADTLVFGSESGDLNALQKLAGSITDTQTQDPAFHDILVSSMKQGKTYPQAFSEAMRQIDNGICPDANYDLLNNPNDLLGIEYIRSLAITGSRITPCTVRREQHSDRITSASEIRQKIRGITLPDDSGSGCAELSMLLPDASFRELRSITGALPDPSGMDDRPVFADDLSSILSYCLVTTTPSDYASYGDINEDLANRIAEHRLLCQDFEQFAALIKTKAYTLARVKRCLMQLILGIRRETRTSLLENQTTVLRVLGFREVSRSLLKELGSHASAPVILRGADYRAITPDDPAYPLVQLDLTASALYDQLSTPSILRKHEAAKQPVIL